MATYKCIGRGVTDENGVAHLTHNCSGTQLQTSGYKGTGKGQTQIIASLDTPSQINDGSVVSVPCNVLDCVKYDSGIYGSATNIYYLTNGLTRTVEEDGSGTTFSVTNGNSSALSFINLSDGSPCVFEFEVVSADSQLSFYVRDNATMSTSISLQVQNYNKLKFVFDGSKLYLYYNDYTNPSITRDMTTTGTFGYYVIKSWGTSSWTMKIKNVKSYYI